MGTAGFGEWRSRVGLGDPGYGINLNPTRVGYIIANLEKGILLTTAVLSLGG